MGRPPAIGTNLMVSFCLLAIQTKGPLNGLASFLLSPARSEVDTNTLAPTGNRRVCTYLSNCSLLQACICFAWSAA